MLVPSTRGYLGQLGGRQPRVELCSGAHTANSPAGFELQLPGQHVNAACPRCAASPSAPRAGCSPATTEPCTESLGLARNPTITNQVCVGEGKVGLRNCSYFQGQLGATGGSVTQKCPLGRARLKAPSTAEEFRIPRTRHSLAQRNEVFSAPTRLQRFLFSPRLQQQLSFKAQTPALQPDPLQPTAAKRTRSDALAPRVAVLPAGRAGSGEMLPATQRPAGSCPFPSPHGQRVCGAQAPRRGVPQSSHTRVGITVRSLLLQPVPEPCSAPRSPK